MSAKLPRVCLLSQRQAWPWRWEMALLEIGSRQGWRLPGAEALAERARTIGQALQSQETRVALAFDGYTVVGACWRTAFDSVDTYGPFVVPRQAEDDLGSRLLRLMEEKDRLPVEEGALACVGIR